MSASCFVLRGSCFIFLLLLCTSLRHPDSPVLYTLPYALARTHAVQASRPTWNLHVPIINIHSIAFVVVVVVIIVLVVITYPRVLYTYTASSSLDIRFLHAQTHTQASKLPSRRRRFRGVGFWIFVAAHDTCGMLVSHGVRQGEKSGYEVNIVHIVFNGASSTTLRVRVRVLPDIIQ